MVGATRPISHHNKVAAVLAIAPGEDSNFFYGVYAGFWLQFLLVTFWIGKLSSLTAEAGQTDSDILELVLLPIFQNEVAAIPLLFRRTQTDTPETQGTFRSTSQE